jgi:hypothetical protein
MRGANIVDMSRGYGGCCRETPVLPKKTVPCLQALYPFRPSYPPLPWWAKLFRPYGP